MLYQDYLKYKGEKESILNDDTIKTMELTNKKKDKEKKNNGGCC